MGKQCVKYAPARMDKRVAIQSIARVADLQGGFDESWVTDVTVSAWIRPAKGYEKFQAAQLQTPVTHKVTIRYRSGVTTAQRLLYGSRVLEIKEVINPDEANAFLELICMENA